MSIGCLYLDLCRRVACLLAISLTLPTTPLCVPPILGSTFFSICPHVEHLPTLSTTVHYVSTYPLYHSLRVVAVLTPHTSQQ